MTPGARVAAAIEVLKEMAKGQAAEQALTRWARQHRFAGSKDRAAIRDHVFDVLRCKALAAHYGQGNEPRALMIGILHLQAAPLERLFDGAGYGPPPLLASEGKFPGTPTDKVTLFNLPLWLVEAFEWSLGAQAKTVAETLQQRAPVFLRVNTARITRPDAQAVLRGDGIETTLNARAETALTVSTGARKVRQSNAFIDGLVELQDGSSQAVTADIPPGGRVLDFCAGGGGKALALAMDQSRVVFAHDIDPRRMEDIPARAARAQVTIELLTGSETVSAAPFDTVLCDAPCSGSGAWRRTPEAKWTLTPERLQELTEIQDKILDQAADLVAKKGRLVFATCSVLRAENGDRTRAFLSRHPDWRLLHETQFLPDAEGDGFYAAHLARTAG